MWKKIAFFRDQCFSSLSEEITTASNLGSQAITFVAILLTGPQVVQCLVLL